LAFAFLACSLKKGKEGRNKVMAITSFFSVYVFYFHNVNRQIKEKEKDQISLINLSE
jgi:hypothetical protein